jgi:Fic family protein
MVKELLELDNLKIAYNASKNLHSYKVAQAIDIEYTYESNKIEGNTLTLQETQLVIEKGLTISGKPLREHLEATNHYFAIEFIKQLVVDKTTLTQNILLQIHQLILQGIDNSNAGTFRKVQVLISGAKHIPPQPYLVATEMENFFVWYNENKTELHPVELAALLHLKLVTIHPFIDGNGRTSRLLMNLVLLQNNYPIAILKGDAQSRLKYYAALEAAQVENNAVPFLMLIIERVKDSFERLIK